MFRYEDTGRLSEPREKQTKVVTERRDKTYTREIFDKKGNFKKTLEYKGWEIVTEMVIDPRGPNKDLL